MIKLNYL